MVPYGLLVLPKITLFLFCSIYWRELVSQMISYILSPSLIASG
jgi:hypothetical protein